MDRPQCFPTDKDGISLQRHLEAAEKFEGACKAPTRRLVLEAEEYSLSNVQSELASRVSRGPHAVVKSVCLEGHLNGRTCRIKDKRGILDIGGVL
jgi:hypothetical protein